MSTGCNLNRAGFALLLLVATMATAIAQPFASFQPLGMGFTAECLSKDGKVVVGYDAADAAYWKDGTLVHLGIGAGSVANSCNEDGSVIVGQTSDNYPFVWSIGGGWQKLHLLAGTTAGKATLISADGSTAAGFCDSTPAIWSVAGVFQLRTSNLGSVVLNAITDDGSTIVGEDPAAYAMYAGPDPYYCDTDPHGTQYAAIWSIGAGGAETSEIALQPYNPYNDNAYESLFCVTSDGKAAFGATYDIYIGSEPIYAGGTLGTIYYSNLETHGLWTTAYNGLYSYNLWGISGFEVHSCNFNGSVLAGRTIQGGFNWDPNGNPEAHFVFGNARIAIQGQSSSSLNGTDLATFLLARGADLEGWTLFKVPTQGMSRDGQTLIGRGQNSSWQDEYWLATISPRLTALTFSSNPIVGGREDQAVLTTDYPAGFGSAVTVTCSDPEAIVPASYPIAAGATTLSYKFTVNPVPETETVTLTASLGPSKISKTLQIQAPTLSTFTLASAIVKSAQPVLAHVTLSGKAPKNGLSVGLSSNPANLVTPSSLNIASGQSYLFAYITPGVVSSPTTLTITASLGSTKIPVVVTVQPPALTGFTLASSSVVGGKPVLAHFLVAAKAVAPGEKISLSSSSTAVAVPTSVIVPVGQSYLYQYLTTSGVTSATDVTITAAVGSKQIKATITLTPPGPIVLSYLSTARSIQNAEFAAPLGDSL